MSDNDVLGFAEQNVEEDIEAMEFSESSGEIGELFHDATAMMEENTEIVDASVILRDLELDNCTLVELRMHLDQMRKVYQDLVDLKTFASSMMDAFTDDYTTNKISQAIAEANAEVEVEGGHVITPELVEKYTTSIDIQSEQYKQVIQVIIDKIKVKEAEIDTPSKSRDDVRVTSERLLAKYENASIENKRQRKVLEKMIDAYNDSNDYTFLFNHANQPWTHIKYAKKAILELVRKKGKVDDLMYPLVKELRMRTSTPKTEGNWKFICDSMWLELNKICIAEDADFAFPDKYKELVAQIVMYTALSDWIALLRSSRIRGNGAYVRVFFSNVIDSARGVSDIITLEESQDIMNGLLKIYLGNIIPYLPRRLVRLGK